MTNPLRRLADRLLERPVHSNVRAYDELVGRVRSGAGGPVEDVFARVCVAVRSALGLEPYDVQLVGAAAMADGRIAEMQTGEGKTLVAVFPAALRALAGSSVHVLTANDYLARRDAAWMGPVYEALGLTVGCVQHGMARDERRRAYACDVVYATANEVGFDYLRDRLAVSPDEVVQRPLQAAIVDEVDSILIDEGRVPLVVAGGRDEAEPLAVRAALVVASLDPGSHFDIDEYERNVFLTDAGMSFVEARLGDVNLYADENIRLLTAVNQALHARALLSRDVDYLVKDGAVELIDAFKGRVASRRRWPDGLHAAVEAKEGVEVTHEARILSMITLQALIRLYPWRCGMTGTAVTSAEEFRELFGLEVVVVPANRPCIREDHSDEVFATRAEKEDAVVREVVTVHATGRPVLLGTASVEESERLAGLLGAAGAPCRVLNARNDEVEAAIVAEAGSSTAVTVSTNMAGRGTDIRLGGHDESSREAVAALGGLYVIGTNRHDSRRIDNQLRGRAGRQGDPGSSRFFVSLEDDLVRQYGLEEAVGSALDARAGRRIERAQELVDALNYQLRANLWRYSAVVEQQRSLLHERRQRVLFDGSLGDVEREVTLAHIDRLWEDHLAYVADVREGVHLMSLGKLSPTDEFRRAAIEAFDEAISSLDERVASTLASIEQGADLASLGLARPSATWTYLMGDTPALEGEWGRLFKGLKKMITGRR